MITARRLYKNLLRLYPKTFRERLAESMEQTFNDLCREKQETSQPFLLFMISVFAETSISILQENLLVIKEINPMKNILTNLGSSTLISLLLILPFMIMEVVNRRTFNEDFPTVLFFAMWLNLFAVCSILLPILVRGRQAGNHDLAHPVPTQGNTLLTDPKLSLIISIALILAPGILPLMDYLGWLSVDRLVNGPNPEVEYLPGLLITVGLILFPIAGGIIASRPIVSALQGGRSLFAHPIHLVIVFVLSFLFASGFVSFVVDQWPCFIGVPVCD